MPEPSTIERTPVAYLAKRNGAWIIQWVGVWPADQPEDDNFDVAASLVVAKRLAKEKARTFASNLRWSEEGPLAWTLYGIEDEWNDDW